MTIIGKTQTIFIPITVLTFFKFCAIQVNQFCHSNVVLLEQPLQHSVQRRGQGSHTIFTPESAYQCKAFS